MYKHGPEHEHTHMDMMCFEILMFYAYQQAHWCAVRCDCQAQALRLEMCVLSSHHEHEHEHEHMDMIGA